MNGLELSKDYYYEILEPRIRSDCPHCLERIAVGLFGHGSQCLGFDDEISRDHDWGPRVCILLNDADHCVLSPDLELVIRDSPSEHHGYKASWEWLGPRGGVLKTNQWFEGLLDGKEIPKKPADWLPIREYELLWTTNGEIWHDGPGDVTKLRSTLSNYPEEVWMKRLAAKCAQISQSSGNVGRSVLRNDTVASGLALYHFAKDAMHIWFLLHRRYAPFYKWLHRAFEGLPGLPNDIARDISLLFGPPTLDEKEEIVRKVLAETRKAVNAVFPFVSTCDEFWQAGSAINERITDSEVKSSGLWDQVEY